MTKIVIKNLGLYCGGRWLFRHLNLEIAAGDFLAVVGPSGAGKSSFLACLAGLCRPTEGTIVYHKPDDSCKSANGSSIDDTGLSPHHFRTHIGILFQNLLLTESRTALDNVLCGRLHRLPFIRTLFGFPAEFKQEAFDLLYDLGLEGCCHRPVREISGGECQRVALARTLFQNPSFLLADEPVAQLDAYLTGRVLGILKLQSTRYGKTVLCVLHNQELVARFADNVLSFNPHHPDQWKLRSIKT